MRGRRGAVRHRPDATLLQARLRFRKREYTKGGFATRAEAQRWLDRTYRRLERATVLGIVPLRRPVTLRAYLPRWRRHIAKEVSRKTLANYRSISDGILEPLLGGMLLEKIGPAEIEDLLISRLEMGRKPSTVNQYLLVLDSIYRLAVKQRYALSNPARKVDRIRLDELPPRYLTDEEEARLLAALPSWLREAAVVAIESGLRLSELAALTRTDIDFAQGLLYIPRSKNSRSREVGITKRMEEVLRARLARLPDHEGPIFDEPGRPAISRRGYWKPFVRARRKAGLPEFRWHDLRHAAGCRMAEAGATPAEIAAVLGHRTLQMTLRYIRHAPRTAARTVARLLDDAESRR